MFQQNENVLQNTNLKALYAYRLQLADEHLFKFGLSAGINSHSLNMAKLYTGDMNDQVIQQYEEGDLSFIGGIGVDYSYQNIKAGLSIPEYHTYDQNTIPVFANASYQYDYSDKITIQPEVMYHHDFYGSNMVDFRVMGSFKQMVWAEVGYRTTNDIILALGANYKEFGVSYAYGISNQKLKQINQSNHEVVVSVSFDQIKLKKRKKNRETTANIQQNVVVIKKDVEKLKVQDSIAQAQLDKVSTNVESVSVSIQQLAESQNIALDEMRGQLFEIKAEELSERSKGCFVVVASHKTEEAAKNEIARIAKLGIDAYPINYNKRNHHYVFTDTNSDLSVAIELMQKRRKEGFADAWVLIVK